MKLRSVVASAALLTAAIAAPTSVAEASVDLSAASGRGEQAATASVINSAALDGLGSGSTVGPDGALYVTNGKNGTLVRIDPSTGAATVVGDGLPPAAVEIGGAMDVVFLGDRAYVLVTLAGADVGMPDATMGIYQQGDDGTFTLFADIGSWAAAHPPADPDFFLSQGVQYALDVLHRDLLVTDAHHARVYRIDPDGTVGEFLAFPSTDTVPTGIDTAHGRVYLASAGPIPHLPSTAKILQIDHQGDADVAGAWASSYQGTAGLIVDVEVGRRGQLYGLLQGHWDLPPIDENEGLPAAHSTGELVRVGKNGTFETVVSGLDQPTSVDFIGDAAFVVTLTGTIVRIDGL
jgi:sugar lactone lactonase YvrE